MDHMRYLELIGSLDIEVLREKERTYKGSWKKRGGIGAFMMLARKWDRLESMCDEEGFDIFSALRSDMSGNDGTPLAEVRDLRRYLLLVEAEITACRNEEDKIQVHNDGTPKEDSNRHATDASIHARQSVEETEVPANNRGRYAGLDRP